MLMVSWLQGEDYCQNLKSYLLEWPFCCCIHCLLYGLPFLYLLFCHLSQTLCVFCVQAAFVGSLAFLQCRWELDTCIWDQQICNFMVSWKFLIYFVPLLKSLPVDCMFAELATAWHYLLSVCWKVPRYSLRLVYGVFYDTMVICFKCHSFPQDELETSATVTVFPTWICFYLVSCRFFQIILVLMR